MTPGEEARWCHCEGGCPSRISQGERLCRDCKRSGCRPADIGGDGKGYEIGAAS